MIIGHVPPGYGGFTYNRPHYNIAAGYNKRFLDIMK